MRKLLGMLLMLVGWWMGLYRGTQAQRKRQAFMEACIRLFAGFAYAVEVGHVRLYDFLEGFETGQEQLSDFLADLKKLLQENQYAGGQAAWRAAMEKNCPVQEIRGEAREILMASAEAFFGTSSQESLRCIEVCRRRMEECLERERKEYRKKRRVYMPVGMLSGLMLVILLI